MASGTVKQYKLRLIFGERLFAVRNAAGKLPCVFRYRPRLPAGHAYKVTVGADKPAVHQKQRVESALLGVDLLLLTAYALPELAFGTAVRLLLLFGFLGY